MLYRNLIAGSALVTVIASCFGAYAFGVQLHEASLIERGRVIDDENRTFCGKYATSGATSSFDGCIRDVAELRRHHELRLSNFFRFGAD